MSDYSKRPDQLFASSRSSLGKLFQHAKALLAVEKLINKLVPGKVQVASLENQILSVHTSSAALATRIKYSQNALISGLSRQKRPIIVKSIRIQVRPDLLIEQKDKDPVFTAKLPSEENGKRIAEAAKYIEDDSLRKALIQLSQLAAPTEDSKN